MAGILLYIVIQIVFLAASISILLRRRELMAQGKKEKVPAWKMVTALFVIPLIGFGYACLGGFPLKTDQLYFAAAITILGYGAIVFRWIRQTHSAKPENGPGGAWYLYQSVDGTVCGPFQRVTMMSRYRSGLIHLDSLVAREESPADWKALKAFAEFNE